jgi:hypothetical protein
MTPARFEPAITPTERPRACSLDRTATGCAKLYTVQNVNTNTCTSGSMCMGYVGIRIICSS